MADPGTLALLAIAVALLLLVSIRFAAYRVRHPFSREDLKRERADAASRSLSVLSGKASEQLLPLLPDFYDRFDPSDARFLGSPVDYVVFDGLKQGELRSVVLLEVKSGSGRLSGSERNVKRAVDEGRVDFEVLRLP